VLLVRVTNQIFAIGNQCTHQGAGLDRGVVVISGSVRTVTCPAHGSMFDLEPGKPMRPPATKPVPVYDVKVEDGRVGSLSGRGQTPRASRSSGPPSAARTRAA
jgi:3-phenylpropionate/trans-cinnamate dioxygenase ferredoxin subunit